MFFDWSSNSCRKWIIFVALLSRFLNLVSKIIDILTQRGKKTEHDRTRTFCHRIEINMVNQWISMTFSFHFFKIGSLEKKCETYFRFLKVINVSEACVFRRVHYFCSQTVWINDFRNSIEKSTELGKWSWTWADIELILTEEQPIYVSPAVRTGCGS